MTTLREINLTCPCCDEEFESTAWASTNTAGKQTTDFYQYAGGLQSINFDVHFCPTCGYTGYESDFDSPVDDELRAQIAARLTPLVTEEGPKSTERYEYSAWIAGWRSEGSQKIGDRYLKAAWCAMLANDPEGEIEYRRQAIPHFDDAINKGEIVGERLALVSYLMGELYRRVGESDTAAGWYDRASEAAKGFPEIEWLVEVAQDQKTEPKDFFE